MTRHHAPASGSLAADSGATPATTRADPLSDVLKVVRLSGALFFSVEITAPWSAEVPSGETIAPCVLPHAQHVISYHVVTHGTCWGALPGQPAVELHAGDVLVLPRGDRYAMATSPPVFGTSNDAAELAFLTQMAGGQLPPALAAGGGGSQGARIVCGFLGCDLQPYNPLLESLPSLLVVGGPGSSTDDPLAALVSLALRETQQQQAGGACVLMRLAELMFVEVLRRHLRTAPADATGWLAALGDPCIGRALSNIHARPAHAWTLEELATATGSSRSAFCEKFAKVLGCAPMQYLTRWRMQIAAGLLADGADKIAAIALHVGYDSEAAFSRAFKKATGVSPSAWRTRRDG